MKFPSSTNLPCAALVGGLVFTRTLARAADPLPSWNDGKAKQSIVAFVEKVTKEGSADFVPVAERIATNGGRPDRPGIANRPGGRDRPDIGNRPGLAENHPNLGDNRPGDGDRHPNLDNRPGKPPRPARPERPDRWQNVQNNNNNQWNKWRQENSTHINNFQVNRTNNWNGINTRYNERGWAGRYGSPDYLRWRGDVRNFRIGRGQEIWGARRPYWDNCFDRRVGAHPAGAGRCHDVRAAQHRQGRPRRRRL